MDISSSDIGVNGDIGGMGPIMGTTAFSDMGSGAGSDVLGTDPNYPLHVQIKNSSSGRVALLTLKRQDKVWDLGSNHFQELEGVQILYLTMSRE